uniref:TIL domain-containing protein n=1 Tax=Ascaris lumbricoides TaxID=6252 RepID=A0A0M3HH62_ASCLU
MRSQFRQAEVYFSATPNCGDNMEFQTCGTACQETCADEGIPKPCTYQCVQGCFCKNGFVLDKEDGEIPYERRRLILID